MHFSSLKTTWMLYFKLCHLEEMDVILCVWKLLQLSISPLQLSNLLLQSLQESFSPTHLSLLLSSDQLFHLRAPSLNGADHLSKDPLTVLHCCLCRALLGDTQRGGVHLKQPTHSAPPHSLVPTVWLRGAGKWLSITDSCLADWRRALIEPEMAPPAASCCPPLLWSVLTLRVSTAFLRSFSSFSLSWILCWILLWVCPKCVYVEGIHHIQN